MIGMNGVSLHGAFACVDGVSPDSMSSDLGDRALRNLIMIRESFQRRPSFTLSPDRDGIGVSEFCLRMLRTLESEDFTENIPRVQRVAPHRCVFQILQAIAFGIAISVIDHFSRVRRSDEGMHHQSVQHESSLSSAFCIPMQGNTEMPGMAPIDRQQPSRMMIHPITPRRNLLHSAMRTYFIQPLETRHWKPLLSLHAPDGAR